jgi:ubiquinone/menaquinone biosynthesis C-methylase UbiE
MPVATPHLLIKRIYNEVMKMNLYQKYLLPRIIHSVCGLKPMMEQRQKIVPMAYGHVLEIGIGSGLNLPFYDSNKVDHLWGLDPSLEMWALAKKTLEKIEFDVTFIQGDAEEVPLPDSSADTVLITYALCTIPDVHKALGEIRRVLKPAGQLLFCEHGAAPDVAVRQWQNLLTPTWKKLGGGCHLNRDISSLLNHAGFDIQKIDLKYIPGWKPAGFNYLGLAMSS